MTENKDMFQMCKSTGGELYELFTACRVLDNGQYMPVGAGTTTFLGSAIEIQGFKDWDARNGKSHTYIVALRTI